MHRQYFHSKFTNDNSPLSSLITMKNNAYICYNLMVDTKFMLRNAAIK